jgi:uncharacterized membrane protein
MSKSATADFDPAVAAVASDGLLPRPPSPLLRRENSAPRGDITMGLVVLILGLILFLGPHVFVTLRPQRDAAVKQLGEGPYKGLFAALSLAGLYVTGKGFGMYDAAGPLVLWTAPAWMRHITEALMLFACIFVAAAYLRGNIKRVLKHPLLVGVKTWAVAHLLVNGDVGGIILFGSVLAWAVYDRITLKRRSDPGELSIAEGGLKNDIAAVVVGIILYLALGFVFHPLIVGRHVFGTSAFGT